ncbi:MAG: FG-GAP-like repeat-containing protein [Myxococcota bacterium]|jgi:hypothetical protein|nr:FG-GAP-like repeat-containing protein [Myxococcota bacterium]
MVAHVSRRRVLVSVLTLVLAACGATAPDAEDIVDVSVARSDAPPEVESSVEDAGAPLEVPATLGGGFVDLTEDVASWPHITIHPGDAATGRLPDPTYGVFADLDGAPPLEIIISGAANQNDAHRQTYDYDPDTHTLSPRVPALPITGAVAVAEDLDGDGHTDLVSPRPADVVIYWGDEEGRFEGHTQVAPGTLVGDVERTAFHLFDIDQDGWLDLLMPETCTMMVVMRMGLRTWHKRSQVLQGYETVDPYAVATWSRAGQPLLLLDLGDPYCGFYTAMEYETLDAEGYPLFGPEEIYEDPTITHRDGIEGLASVGPMGAAVADLNRDGVLDLFLTLDPAHAILDGAAGWPVISGQPESGLRLVPSDSDLPQVGWGVALIDLDRDGLDDVVIAHGNDTSRFLGTDLSPGPQWTTAHLNGGGFRFLDVTEHLGLGRRGWWRALTVDDLDGDADPDLIVGGVGEAPRVYRNDIETPHHTLALRLVGRTSNRLGIGARVVVNPVGTSDQRLYAVGAMGGPKAASSPRVFAGLGSATSADVTVTWPSGVVQTVEGLQADETHVVIEPEVLRVEPIGRHLPAGGDEVATLTIRPQEAATMVTATITHGDGLPTEAVETEEGVWVVTVTPPAQPGSARIEVRIDGQPVMVRPRLWWDAP